MKQYEKEIQENFQKEIAGQEDDIVKINQILIDHRPRVTGLPPRKENIQKVQSTLLPWWLRHLSPLTKPFDLKAVNQARGWFQLSRFYILSHWRMIPIGIGILLRGVALALKYLVKILVFPLYLFVLLVSSIKTFIQWIWNVISRLWRG